MSIRYDTPDENGETRRERNARFGMGNLSTPLDIPSDGEYLWSWFWELSGVRTDGFNGPQPLTVPQIEDWSVFTGTIIRRDETAILHTMDIAYRSQISAENAEVREGNK